MRQHKHCQQIKYTVQNDVSCCSFPLTYKYKKHERKQIMADMSDGVIALPGGCGTLEELLEIITWKQLGLYLKPVVILNINHFYDPLLEMLNQAIEQNFMRREHGAIWHVAETPEEAVNLLYNTPVWSKEIRKFAAI